MDYRFNKHRRHPKEEEYHDEYDEVKEGKETDEEDEEEECKQGKGCQPVFSFRVSHFIDVNGKNVNFLLIRLSISIALVIFIG
jgi:hypothetical protein